MRFFLKNLAFFSGLKIGDLFQWPPIRHQWLLKLSPFLGAYQIRTTEFCFAKAHALPFRQFSGHSFLRNQSISSHCSLADFFELISLKFEFFKLTVIIADPAHFESVPPSFCRFASSCNALCDFVRVNLMIRADCYRCRIHVMYFGFFLIFLWCLKF